MSVNMTKMDLILEMKWLEQGASIVHFDTKRFLYKKILMLFGELLLCIQPSEKSVYVSNVGPQYNVPQIDHPLDIKIINEEEFDKLCKNKSLKVYAFKWNSSDDTKQD